MANSFSHKDTIDPTLTYSHVEENRRDIARNSPPHT